MSQAFSSVLDPATVRVAVVLPVRNEALHLGSVLQSVLDQTFPADRLEIIVVDGRSSDATVSIAERLLAERGNWRIVSNPTLTIPSGMNLGIRLTTADVVVRVDGHTWLEPEYVDRCVQLLASTGAANVGGLMRPRGQGLIGTAMAVALCSRFGIGDSRFHYSDREEFVETVYMGAFRKQVLDELGGYDISVLSNEDFELNHRIVAAGYRILLSPAIRSAYTPRGTIPQISRQFFRYGLWKSRVVRKHPRSTRPRHLVPPALVTALAVTIPLFLFTKRRRYLLPTLVYVTGVVFASRAASRERRVRIALAAIFPAMHLSWGAGVLVGFVRSLRPVRPGS